MLKTAGPSITDFIRFKQDCSIEADVKGKISYWSKEIDITEVSNLITGKISGITFSREEAIEFCASVAKKYWSGKKIFVRTAKPGSIWLDGPNRYL